MSEESKKVERALREVTGGSTSDIRQLSKQLIELGQQSLNQQQSRVPDKQVTPTGMVTTQIAQSMSTFDEIANKKNNFGVSESGGFRVIVDGFYNGAIVEYSLVGNLV